MKEEIKMAIEAKAKAMESKEADARVQNLIDAMSSQSNQLIAAGLPQASGLPGYASVKREDRAWKDKDEQDFMDDLGSTGIKTTFEVMKAFGIPADRYGEVSKILGEGRVKAIERSYPR